VFHATHLRQPANVSLSEHLSGGFMQPGPGHQIKGNIKITTLNVEKGLNNTANTKEGTDGPN